MSGRFMMRDDGVIFAYSESACKRKNFREIDDPYEEPEEVIIEDAWRIMMDGIDARMREANNPNKVKKQMGRPRRK